MNPAHTPPDGPRRRRTPARPQSRPPRPARRTHPRTARLRPTASRRSRRGSQTSFTIYWEQSSPRTASFAALHTRAKKGEADADEILKDRWAAEADSRGLFRRFTPTDLTASVEVPQLTDGAIVEQLVGPEGLTEKSSGFGRRDVLVAEERLLGQATPRAKAAIPRWS
jgi:hypothetical protein